jgi:4-amino-4-deoxy-L-arabinose transferase-like glycosyltransferase
VRITALETAPPTFSFDEGSFAQEAAAIAEGRFYASPFEPAWLSHPRLFFCIIALSINAFGRTVMAARLPAAIFGGLGIPAVYMLGRRMFGRRVGLAAAIFLTGFHIHLHFSRLALNNIVDPLWATIAFSLLLRGLETGRLSDFGLSGLALGMSQYGYAAARLIPVIMIAYLLLVLILRPQSLRRRWPHLLILVLGAVIITWPSDWFYISQAYPLTTRLSATGLFATGRFDVMRTTMSVGEILWEQTKWSWLALIHTYDRSGFYGAITPVMGQFADGIFLLGAAYSLLRLPRLVKGRIWRDDALRDSPAALLPMLWIAATIFAGSALLIDPPQFPRYVLLLPAAALLVGLGIVETLDLLLPLAPKARRWAPAALSLALMTADVVFYFDIYLYNQPYANNYNTLMGDAVARYVREETEATPSLTIYYLTAPRVFLDNSTLVSYFAPDAYDRDLLGGFTELPEDFNPYVDNLFILGVDQFRDLDLLIQAAPGGVMEEHWSRDGDLLFMSYRLSPSDAGE